MPIVGRGMPSGAPRETPPGAGGAQIGGGQQGGNQERVLMTLLTMLSQMPEAQVMLPVGALTTLVEGGGAGRRGGVPQRGPAPSGLATAGQPGVPSPSPQRPSVPQPGGVMGGGMPRTQVPARQMMGGAQPRGNAQALMRLLGGG